MIQGSPLQRLETIRTFLWKHKNITINRFQNFVSSRSCIQDLFAELQHFRGGGGGFTLRCWHSTNTANCGKTF